jgi:hypothetical protein
MHEMCQTESCELALADPLDPQRLRFLLNGLRSSMCDEDSHRSCIGPVRLARMFEKP